MSILNFHYCTPPDAVAVNYDLKRVIGENETGFRGRDDAIYRTEGWDFLLAGGGLYNNLDYSFTWKNAAGTFLEYKSPGGGSPTLRRQLRVLKEFLYGFDFIRMTPDNSVIRSVIGGMSARALVQPGRAYAIYVHAPLPHSPKPPELQKYLNEPAQVELILNLAEGKYLCEWVNTKTGEVTPSEKFTHAGGDKPLKSQPFTSDIALRLATEP